MPRLFDKLICRIIPDSIIIKELKRRGYDEYTITTIHGEMKVLSLRAE
jgi:hypothetical protein